jgi:hypothetical protein
MQHMNCNDSVKVCDGLLIHYPAVTLDLNQTQKGATTLEHSEVLVT